MKTLVLFAFVAVSALPAAADSFFFSTGNVTDSIAIATRPETAGKFEIEAADDFVLNTQARINSATFTGLLTGGATTANISQVVLEIYRVFSLDSDVGRTSGAPVFSTSQVPTRVNSPSDVALDSRDSSGGGLSFETTLLTGTFTSQNSITPGGIHPAPDQRTQGNGSATGAEVQITANLTAPFDLPAGHYFFVPQVAVTTPDGEFLWLSGTRPIVAPGTPFLPDLQAWTRDQFLDPDWLRAGTDIVGGSPATTFNLAFSLNATEVPEPASVVLVVLGAAAVAGARRFRKV